MSQPPVSLIIVSRHRAAALMRAIRGVMQLDHPKVELIVVADPAAAAQVAGLGLAAKIVPFDEANISAARNAGLARAGAGLVAFLDDDAVPEPTWLSRLVAPFADAPVVAATGFTRGRNGLSLQWMACEVDCCGADHPLDLPPGVSLHRGDATRAVKTVGTNCAFHRDVLLAVGGFDPAFRFYLDEADVNLRLAGKGLTAVVPDAQVHHGFAESARRRADRVPLSLNEIGASAMVFLRRHAAPGQWAAALEQLRVEQRRRLLRHMVDGRLEPRDVERLLSDLSKGIDEGARRSLDPLLPMKACEDPFLPLGGTGPRAGLVLAGRPWQRSRLRQEARAAVQAGRIVTLIRLSPTALYHRHAFHADGYWEQTGGLFGRAERQEPLLRRHHFAGRLAAEARRLSAFRPMA